jgi:hypothetical protein
LPGAAHIAWKGANVSFAMLLIQGNDQQAYSACTMNGVGYIARMNSKHRKTLQLINRDPAPETVAWAEIESLLISVGCRVIEGRGSRVRFVFGDEIETFHRPHPAKEAKRYQVRAAREFLARIGVEP